MSEVTNLQSTAHRFSFRTLLWLVAIVAVGSASVAYFGWKGINSTVCLSIAGVLLVFGKQGLAIALIALLSLGQFVYPAMDGAREAILRTECQDNIRRLTIAIHDYESEHGHVPPPYLTDSSGKPIHSWRVLILPFLGEQKLYDQIDKTKPWDDPVNRPFHEQMPEVFCCSANKYHSKWRTTGVTTTYIVVVGDDTAWRPSDPPSLTQIPDGTSRTIAVVESERHRMAWMSPNDPNVKSFIDDLDFSRPHHGLLNASCLDGSTQVLSDRMKVDQIIDMLNVSDGNSHVGR